MQYKAPIRDIQFVMHELLKFEEHYKAIPAFAEIDKDTLNSYVEAGADFAENELSPLNRTGDEEGCGFDNGVVTTPTGFKSAYEQYCELGFTSLCGDVAHEGQGLPISLGSIINELVGSANWSFSMYPGLSEGAIRTIEHHGTEEQKQTYLAKLISGKWSGTMCLTEAHAGSDLGIIRTKAEPNADGSYAITGQKIFISAGEHDLTENIIHVVLARLPDAPAGTKGISLFIVPKLNINTDGSIGERNQVSCGSIEHKMGIKASATCVMNFDKAKGFLIAEPNKGLNAMFTFMNTARIGTAIQGLCASEIAFQGGFNYAKERIAMRSLTGAKNPEQPADPIIVHPAVRNMVLTCKAFSEGGRALVYYLSQFADIVAKAEDPAKVAYADEMLSLLTPIAKAFLTETGYESANHGVQVYGGHGFIREWGMEQNVRDTRIACLYEGTTEIQSLDLLARKVLGSNGKLLQNFGKVIQEFCQENATNSEMQQFINPLADLAKQWGDLTTKIGQESQKNPEFLGASAVDYMYFSGYVTLAYLWAKMALVAQQALQTGTTEEKFYQAKIKTAQFYFAKLLPRTLTYVQRIENGADSLMSMAVDEFIF